MKILSDLREFSTDARGEFSRVSEEFSRVTEDFRGFALAIVTLLGVSAAALVTIALRSAR